MASVTRTAFPSREEYMEQVRAVDAGNPKTAVPQKQAQGFQPAESSGMAMPAPARTPVPTGAPPKWSMGEIVSGVADEYGKDRARRQGMAVSVVKSAAGALGRFGENMTEGQYLGTNPALAQAAPSGSPSGVAPAPTQGIAAAAQTQFEEVRKEQEARQNLAKYQSIARDINDAGNPLPTPEQIRHTALEKNGFDRANAPKSANPGLTLSATPAQESPRKPLPYTGVFSQSGPQEALQRKQMEVMAAERADKTLLQAPGSRDYISPTLTEPQMRERQAEIATQRKQDMEDVAAQQVGQATVKMMDDQNKGITSDRNLAMMPYAQRRAVINDRRALTDLNANMQAKRLEEQGKAEGREAEMTRAEMADSTTRRGQDLEVDVQGKKLTSEERRAMLTDSTTRRGQDIDQETNLTNSEIAARSKELDRQAQKEVALIRRTAPVDRVKLESIKAYYKFIGDQVGLNPELRNDPAFLESAMGTYGLTAEDLKAQMMSAVNPEEDEDFLN